MRADWVLLADQWDLHVSVTNKTKKAARVRGTRTRDLAVRARILAQLATTPLTVRVKLRNAGNLTPTCSLEAHRKKMARRRRRGSGEGKTALRWLRARGRLPGGAAWRGEDVGVDGVDGDVLQRRGTGVAAEDAGELRVAAASLHQKRKGEALRKRQSAGNVKEEAEGRKDVGGDQIEAETVAEMAAQASNGDSPGARFGEETEGKRRGSRGLLIGRRKEMNQGFNRHIEGGGIAGI